MTADQLTRRPLTDHDRRDLFNLVRSIDRERFESFVVAALGPFGYHASPRPSTTTSPMSELFELLLHSLEVVQVRGFVVERHPIWPAAGHRWFITGWCGAQARACEIGLIGGSSPRSCEDPQAIAIVQALEDGELDSVVVLAAELAARTGDFTAALTTARLACN